MSDVGEGLIFVGQLADDWKKGDFSRSFKGCGACGCFVAIATMLVFVGLLVIGLVFFRSGS